MSCIAAAFPSVATHVSSVTVRLGSSRRTCPRSHGFRNSRIAVGSLVRLLLRITQYSHLLIALRSLRCNRPWSVWHHRGLPNPGHCPPPVVSLPLPFIRHCGWSPLPHAIWPLRTQKRFDTCSAVSYLHNVGTVPSGGCIYVKMHAHTRAVCTNIRL